MTEIILIDDDEIQFLLIKGIAKRLNSEFKITYFSNPEEALKDLETRKEANIPLLILLDLNMPEMSGWEFLEKYSLFTNKSKVAILTSSIDNSDINKSNNHKDVMEYLSKPLTINQLEVLTKECSKI